jgi:hypothetical protein
VNRYSALFFTLAVVTSNAALAMTGGSVGAAFHGQWVPVKASCNSPLKLVIGPNTVTFVNGAQRAVYPKLEQCFTCMGRDVTNIVLLSTDAMGDSPFMIHLDTTKKQPVLVDFSNDKKLGARFPLGSGALKKCA